MAHYFTLNTSIELLCLLIAVISLRKNGHLLWRSIIIFLLITCVAEIMGIYVKRLYLSNMGHFHPNAWVYNILIFFQIGFFSLMFFELLKKYSNAKPIILSCLVALMAFHIYNIFERSIYVYDERTKTVMSILFVLYSFYFYYCLLKDDNHEELRKLPDFWLATGVLFFYFGTTAFNLFYDNLSQILSRSKDSLSYLKYITNTLNIILYGCWSYSFICRRWLTTTSKS
jgi:uncharacterized membrane protein YfcA